MLVTKCDRWESTSQRASNVWTLLAECTYVYSWYEWLYYWRIHTRERGGEISFYRKRKCFCFFSFPKKEYLSNSGLQNANVVTSRDDKALENRRVFVCGQQCLSSVLISFFFVSKAACSSGILLVSLCCSPSYSVLWVTTNCCLPFVTQSVHFRYPRSCLRSNT